MPAIVERSLEEDISHRELLWRAEGHMVFRASVPPTRQAASTSAATRCDPQVTRDLIDPVTDTVSGEFSKCLASDLTVRFPRRHRD